jgi:hypothetical protein
MGRLALRLIASVVCLLALRAPAAVAADPEPGPEHGGLRLRLVVMPRAAKEGEGFEVRVDLVNTSEQTITLEGGWERDDDAGSVQDYLEAATTIECVPAIAPWIGGTQASPGRERPQPTHQLPAGETLSMRWQSAGRQLKNRVSDPIVVQNPTFPFPGLYSVHASLDVITTAGTFRLRSNEQLVPVGGSRSMPKHTYGQLWSVSEERKTATLGLGSLHQVQVGDQFDMPSKQAYWRLTITEVRPRYSDGTLTRVDGNAPDDSPLPARFSHAILRQE